MTITFPGRCTSNIWSRQPRSGVNFLKYISSTNWEADRKSLLTLHKTLIHSKLDYGTQVYSSAPDSTLYRLDIIQNQCLHICLGALRYTSISRMEMEAVIPPLHLRHDYLSMKYAFKVSRHRDQNHPSWPNLQYSDTLTCTNIQATC